MSECERTYTRGGGALACRGGQWRHSHVMSPNVLLEHVLPPEGGASFVPFFVFSGTGGGGGGRAVVPATLRFFMASAASGCLAKSSTRAPWKAEAVAPARRSSYPVAAVDPSDDV